MHHSTYTDACTHCWRWYVPGGDKQDTICRWSQKLPIVHIIHTIMHIPLDDHTDIGAMDLLVITREIYMLFVVTTGYPVFMLNVTAQNQIHTHPLGCAMDLVMSSYKLSMFIAGHHALSN